MSKIWFCLNFVMWFIFVNNVQCASKTLPQDIPKETSSAAIFSTVHLPQQYLEFCKREKNANGECKSRNGKIDRLALTTQNWNVLRKVNKKINAKIRPAEDRDIYGVDDFWAYPKTTGDCEDYALLKKRTLVDIGFSPDVLLITLLTDEHGKGHAVLTVVTDRGDFVLDSRTNEVVSWNRTGYIYSWRQSQNDPTKWVALQK
jgi:predicted transglutaminase-like cysteine proteinase